MTCSLPARGGVTYDAVAGAGAGAGRGGVLFVAVAHTVSSQYPQLHCYSFPAPITPPPSLRGGGGSSRSWCRLGGEAAGAGVLCITQEPHSPSPSLTGHHITSSHHHMPHATLGLTVQGRTWAPGGGVPVLTSERLHAVLVSPSSSQPRQRPCSPASPAQPGTLGRILLAECSRTQPTQLAQLAS